MKKVQGGLKLALSQYRDLEAFAQFGSDLDADTRKTLDRGARLVKTLNQGERSPIAVEDQVLQIFAATNGYLDRITVDRAEEYLERLVETARAEIAPTLEKIAGGDWSDETIAAVDAFVAKFTKEDFGYELDEDGELLEQGTAAV